MDVSFLIPARNEVHLERTIRNVLENIRGDSEIIVVLDGYLPDPPIDTQSPRVTFLHYPESIGQRQAINAAARIAKGKYLCKLDAHCAIDEGFDVKVIQDFQPDWTVIPRMYNLDIEKFTPKLHKRTDYMYIGLRSDGELRAEYYTGEEYSRLHRQQIEIDDTMCCMGPCFVLSKDRFWELGGCDENHGGWGQQGIEVACKAWLSGGALKVNKKTWFAHWFRGGNGPGFPYPLTGKEVGEARKYSKDLWLNNKWDKRQRDFQWLLDKFDPPGWKQMPDEKKLAEDLALIYRHIRRIFGVVVKYDFSPIGCRLGVTRENLVDLFKALDFHNGAEIGIWRGHFSHYILSNSEDIHLHAIDPWTVYSESKATAEGQVQNKRLAVNRLQSFIDNGRCSLHADYSQNVVTTIEDNGLDFVFIDGNHSFNHCVMDLIKWSPKVRTGGIVAVHDYCPLRRGGVIEAVDNYTKCNMIAPWFVIREQIPTAFWVKQ